MVSIFKFIVGSLVTSFVIGSVIGVLVIVKPSLENEEDVGIFWRLLCRLFNAILSFSISSKSLTNNSFSLYKVITSIKRLPVPPPKSVFGIVITSPTVKPGFVKITDLIDAILLLSISISNLLSLAISTSYIPGVVKPPLVADWIDKPSL